MSLLRRWFDPIRSSWFYQKPSRQAVAHGTGFKYLPAFRRCL